MYRPKHSDDEIREIADGMSYLAERISGEIGKGNYYDAANLYDVYSQRESFIMKELISSGKPSSNGELEKLVESSVEGRKKIIEALGKIQTSSTT